MKIYIKVIISFIVYIIVSQGEAFGIDADSVSYEKLADSYAKHWLSIDSKEPINIHLEKASIEGPVSTLNLKFYSDDGELVNGKLKFLSSLTDKDKNKLAILMHPMSLDQSFWNADKQKLVVKPITQALIKKGYVVLTLDARLHGKRAKDGMDFRELISRAHSKEPRTYLDTIIGSVRDYRIALRWAKSQYPINTVFVAGYSMGAQMALLFSSVEDSVDHVLSMVPPYISNGTFPVAPRNRVKDITKANVFWLAGRNDKYSSKRETLETFNKITSTKKELVWFDAGHFLPVGSVTESVNYIKTID